MTPAPVYCEHRYPQYPSHYSPSNELDTDQPRPAAVDLGSHNGRSNVALVLSFSTTFLDALGDQTLAFIDAKALNADGPNQ